MKKILRFGLCTLLVGAAALAVKDSVNIEKPGLEMNVQKEFISRNGNYSIKSDPKDYGFALEPQATDTAFPYDDTYTSQIGWLKIGGMEQDGDLKQLYDTYSTLYLKPVLIDAAQRDLGVRLVHKTDIQKLIVDNNPALRSDLEISTYKEGTPRVYTSIVTLRTALSMDEKNVYTFTLCYEPGDSLKAVQANRFYDDVLESFHALKHVNPRTVIAFTIKE